MTNHITQNRRPKPRIELTDADLERLCEIHSGKSAHALAKRSGLPYLLVYNIVHKRVKTVSDRHYRKLFGEPPPPRRPKRVDGDRFRAMVDLWLYLNDGVTKSTLYREFYGQEHAKKPDYRIFSGQVRTVEYGLEQMMRKKFSDAGIDEEMLARWLIEMQSRPRDDRVPYEAIRPALRFLDEHLGVHPTSILNRSVSLYESGELQSVSREVGDRVEALKQKAETAIATGKPREIESVKEEITGKKAGYTLYLDIEEELQFLRRYKKRGVKHYLGRSLWIYETGGAKRIADWRTERIRRDCGRLIREIPDLQVSLLPKAQQEKRIGRFLGVLVSRAARLLSEQEGIFLEKQVLKPSYTREKYKDPSHGFTRFEMAPGRLRMKPKAFDLMVAKNCEIFRSTATYSKRWYVSDLYLKELAQKKIFTLISAKYDLMARKLGQSGPANTCMH